MFNKKMIAIDKEKMIGVSNWPVTSGFKINRLVSLAYKIKDILSDYDIPFKGIELVPSLSAHDTVEFVVYMDRFTRPFDYEGFPEEIAGIKVVKEIVKSRYFVEYACSR